MDLYDFKQFFTCDYCKQAWSHEDKFPQKLFQRLYFQEHFVRAQISVIGLASLQRKYSSIPEFITEYLPDINNSYDLKINLILTSLKIEQHLAKIKELNEQIRKQYMHAIDDIGCVILRSNKNKLMEDIYKANQKIELLQPHIQKSITSSIDDFYNSINNYLESFSHLNNFTLNNLKTLLSDAILEISKTLPKIYFEVRFVEVPREKWDLPPVQKSALKILQLNETI